MVQQGSKQVHEQNGQTHPFRKRGIENPDQHRQGSDAEAKDPSGALHVGGGDRIGRHVRKSEHTAANDQMIQHLDIEQFTTTHDLLGDSYVI